MPKNEFPFQIKKKINKINKIKTRKEKPRFHSSGGCSSLSVPRRREG